MEKYQCFDFDLWGFTRGLWSFWFVIFPIRIAGVPETEQDAKLHPRSEAFVIDFGPNRSGGETRGLLPGRLSQCIPDRLRRGLDERERLKREREKENEIRRQIVSAPVFRRSSFVLWYFAVV